MVAIWVTLRKHLILCSSVLLLGKKNIRRARQIYLLEGYTILDFYLVLITSFVLNLSSPAYNIEVEKSHFDDLFSVKFNTVALQHDMHKLVLINHPINLSHSIQRDKVCLPRAPNNNQSSDEVLARGGVDDAKFTSTQSFSAFRLDTFCPSHEVSFRESDRC